MTNLPVNLPQCICIHFHDFAIVGHQSIDFRFHISCLSIYSTTQSQYRQFLEAIGIFHILLRSLFLAFQVAIPPVTVFVPQMPFQCHADATKLTDHIHTISIKKKHRPDAVLLLGDRFEIFAVAAAAAARHIPIAHISGGDVTLGAADEYYRHCISKMAAVHFPSCADSAARLVRMGEAPGTVFCVGGLGDENIRTMPKMGRRELCDSTGFPLMQPFALVTYHPETAPDAGSPAAQVQALCAAMAAVDGVFWLITGSNADAGGEVCTRMMQDFAAAHPDRAGFVQSLGLRRYLSAMEYAALVAGNSSSGVVETPTFRVPTVNIGRRQAGRTVCANVLCCDADRAAIEAALRKALSKAFAPVAASARSPYNGGNTSEKICTVLQNFDFARPKIFYDGPVPEFDPQRSVLV